MQSYEHDPRQLGIARDPEEAVAKWGVIAWSDKGLNVGTGPHAYLFPRNELERITDKSGDKPDLEDLQQ